MADTATDLPSGEEDGVAEVVRLFLHLRQESGTDLKQVLHLSQPQISERLTGKVDFRAKELRRLATHFNVAPGVFFMSIEDAIRSRCFASIETPGQLRFPIDERSRVIERPALAAVGG